MVDWVIDVHPPAGSRSARRRRRARERRGLRRAGSRGATRAPRHGRRRSLRAAGPRGQSRRHPGSVRRHATAYLAHPPRARRDASPRARCGDGSVLRARRPEAVRPCAPVAGGGLAAIVEHPDATDEQRRVREVNSSIYVFRADTLWPVLDRLMPHNAQGELYLTDSVAHPRRGWRAGCRAQGRGSGGDARV